MARKHLPRRGVDRSIGSVPRIEPITTPDDPRLDAYRSLTDAALEVRHGLYVIESELVARVAIRQHASGAIRLRSLLLTPTKQAAMEDAIGQFDGTVYIASAPILEAIAGFHVHRGVLGLGERLPLPTSRELAARARRLLILEDISNHDNVGGLFRVAAAFGIDGVVLSPRCCDPLYRKAVRVSMGHVLRVPFAWASDWPGELVALRAQGWPIVALATNPDAEGPEALAPRHIDREQRLAILVGAEGTGLQPETLAVADLIVRIPMAPGVDSLNVVVAAGVALSHQYAPASR